MTARRPKMAYIDPRVMHAPGECLRCDGIYRSRAGWDQNPFVLTVAEVAALPASVLTPRRDPSEDEPVRR